MRALFALFALTFAPLAAGQHDHDPDHAEHGFVVLGEGDPHLYHLARFDSPHRYQGLFKVVFMTPAGEWLDLRGLPNVHPDRLWSVVSRERWAMADLGDRTVRSFKADLYEGYLRDQAGRRLVMSNVDVLVDAVEYFAPIAAETPTSQEYKILLTCDRETGTFHGAHFIEGKPGFEEIVRIDTLYSSYWSPTDPDATSTVYPCSPVHQGSILTVSGRIPNSPLARSAWDGGLSVYSPAIEDTVRASGRVVLTDPTAVNR